MRVFISAGEASGDLYGAALIQEFRRRDPNIEILGLGGPRMASEGFTVLGDSSSWGSISILQSTREGLRAIGTYQRLKASFRVGPPGVFVPIDFGYMNLRLCRAARAAGWRVVYFIPPGSWRKDRQGADIPSLTDAVVTNFPWSAEILNRMGANAHFFGHPLKQIHRDILRANSARAGIAVLPGSRRSELEQLLPILGETMTDQPEKATLPVPSHYVDYVRERWSRTNDSVLNASNQGGVISVLSTSDRAVVCSGTATLECALAKTPMVVVYRVSKAVEIEAKIIRFKRPRFFSQPNILLEREVVPELIQETCTPDEIRRQLDALATTEVRAAQSQAFEEIDELLGGDDAITQTVDLVLNLT
jgi:lipid-A-disaccharide synthase